MDMSTWLRMSYKYPYGSHFLPVEITSWTRCCKSIDFCNRETISKKTIALECFKKTYKVYLLLAVDTLER